MRYALDNHPFDTLTIVDSDQLAVRAGYSHYLARFLEKESAVGLLGNSAERQTHATRIPPAAVAWKEIELWRPFLRRFREGEEKFVCWSFWPGTVFSADAARELVRLFATDTQLQEIMRKTNIWATEEVILPTLVALLGYRISLNPCSSQYVRYRVSYSLSEVEDALSRPNAFWIHPISRRYDDRNRRLIREQFSHYQRPSTDLEPRGLPDEVRKTDAQLTLPILARMRQIEGWLDEDEAGLLIATTAAVFRQAREAPTVVEIGPYCGRSTVVLGSVAKAIRQDAQVYAVDSFDGIVGALDQGIRQMPPTENKLRQNMLHAGLSGIVEIIRSRPYELAWQKPIDLLLIDGLHDYVNVARDFYHYEQWVVPGGHILFHDYADYYPGVKAFVNEVLTSHRYRKVDCVRSLMVVQKSEDAQ
jgi:predicted O-methyltransferase YrrM